MADYAFAMQRAADALSRNDFTAALQHCARALSHNGSGFDALHLRAFCLAQLGRHGEALRAYQDALRVNPDFAPLANNMAASQLEIGDYEAALANAAKAVEAMPGFGPALNNLALAHAGLGQHVAALENWQRAEACTDCPVSVSSNRVSSLLALGRITEAMHSAKEGVERAGGTPRALVALISACIEAEDYWQAKRTADALLKMDPQNDEGQRGLASALVSMGDLFAAEPLMASLLERQPNDPLVQAGWGALLLRRGDFDSAIIALRRAIELDPRQPNQHINLIAAYREAGRLDEAKDYARTWRPAAFAPEQSYYLGLLCLSVGLWEIGWELCEQRRLLESWPVRDLKGKDANSLDDFVGKSVFLYSEQGLGDAIMFARFAQELAKQALNVELEVPAPIVGLLSGLKGVRVIAAERPKTAADTHAPLLSVPGFYRVTPDSIADSVPYIFPDGARAAYWHERIGDRGFKIGVAWQGNPAGKVDLGRSFPLRALRGIARIPGVRLISLQKNIGADQLAYLPPDFVIENLGEDFDSGDHAFLDTAAVMSNLDLVISSDTAVAHVAGAMGAPLWVALKHSPDWRWLRDRSDSPWYPTAKLFRQPVPDDWKSVFDKIAEEVASLVEVPWSDDFRIEQIAQQGTFFLRKAHELLKAGAHADALEVCSVGLRNYPEDPDLRYLTAVSLAGLSRHCEAAKEYETSLRVFPEHLELRTNYSHTLVALGRCEDALALLDDGARIIQAGPAWSNAKAVALAGLGRYFDAEVEWRQAIALAPDQPVYPFNLGVVLSRQQRFSEALTLFDKALEADKANEAVLSERVRCLVSLKRFDEALEAARAAAVALPQSLKVQRTLALACIESGLYDEASSLISGQAQEDSAPAETHLLRGVISDRRSNWAGALIHLSKAVEADPNSASAQSYRAVALAKLGRLQEALDGMMKANELSPNDAKILSQTALMYQNLGDWNQARTILEHARDLAPSDLDVHWNLATLQLSMGDLKQGFEAYEVRRKRFQGPSVRSLAGEEATLQLTLLGKRLFLYAEQGLGDTIQFSRFASLIARTAGHVELEVQSPLVELLSGLPGVRVIGRETPPSPYDFHLPLLSMPRLLKIELHSIPRDVPYVKAQPSRVQEWSQRLGPKGFKVGIAWQGNPLFSIDEGRSFSVRLFEPISRIPSVRLISLQKNKGLEQLSELPPGMKIETLGPGFDAGNQAFLDTAAVIANLDLVITSDTSIAHLAGAMGVPVWIALKFAPDWRWMLERSDSPWYPTARLFRQPRPGDWESVFADLASALELQMNRR